MRHQTLEQSVLYSMPETVSRLDKLLFVGLDKCLRDTAGDVTGHKTPGAPIGDGEITGQTVQVHTDAGGVWR